MGKRILILEPSATTQAIFTGKYKKTDYEPCYEVNGLQMVVSAYNRQPDAIMLNARCVSPNTLDLVRLIKNIGKLQKIPLAVYATSRFGFEKEFMEDSGADLFIHFDTDDLVEKTEQLFSPSLLKTAPVPKENYASKSAIAIRVFDFIGKLDSIEKIAVEYLNLVTEFCEVPAVSVFLNENDGVEAFYISASNIAENETNDFLKICTSDFEEIFPDSNILKITPKRLESNKPLEDFRTSDVPLSAYQSFNLTDSNGDTFGTVCTVREGVFTKNQLDLLEFSVNMLGSIMQNAIMLKGKIKFEQNIRKAFSRFVPEQIIDELVENVASNRDGDKVGVGEKRDVAILFSDIRSFTNISEHNKPEVIVAFLNRYFTTMCTIIKKHGGTIDKFIGDAIMALFGAPVSYEDNARRAVAAAYEMREALSSVPLEDLILPDGMKFNIGIGIHYGDVIVGSIGSNDKTDYSVIGDNVNLASRLEGLTKTYGSMILVSQAVKDDIGTDEFVYRPLDDVKVKGKAKAVPIYAIDRGPDEFSEKYRDCYKKGFGLYKQGVFNLAHEYFSNALSEAPDDKACKLMVSRCEEFIKNPPENWDGAIAFNTK